MSPWDLGKLDLFHSVFPLNRLNSDVYKTLSMEKEMAVPFSASKRGPKGLPFTDCSYSPTLRKWYSWLLISGHVLHINDHEIDLKADC